MYLNIFHCQAYFLANMESLPDNHDKPGFSIVYHLSPSILNLNLPRNEIISNMRDIMFPLERELKI